MPKRELRIGKYSFIVGDYVEILAQGRKYRLEIQEIDDYNNIIGTDDDGNPIFIKISKVSVIRKINKPNPKGDKNGNGNTNETK